jgi:hypothetical protein
LIKKHYPDSLVTSVNGFPAFLVASGMQDVMIRGIVASRVYVLAGHNILTWILFSLQVIIELLIIDDPVVPLLVVEAEVVLLTMEPLIIKEPVVSLLIVETNVVALLIIEEPVVPLITEPAAAGHGGSDAASVVNIDLGMSACCLQVNPFDSMPS